MIAHRATSRPLPRPATAGPPSVLRPLPVAAWPQLGFTPWALAARGAQAGFDALRVQHAAAVRAGLLSASLRGSARFEQWVDGLEQATLGPLARRV